MPESDRGERRLDRVGRPQMTPVFGREVIEGEKDVAVFTQALASGGVLGFVFLNELIERFLGVSLRLGLPDLMQIRLRFRLNTPGHLVQDVGRFVDPTALLTSFRKDLAKRRPKSKSAITDGDLGSEL